jgi:hypothetical protein
VKRVLVAAHDAGGAEVVSAWVNRHREAAAYRFVLEGPAIAIFERKIGFVELLGVSQLETSIAECDFVLTGTGYSSQLERTTIAAARTRDVPVASYLDHWTNYRQRFERQGRPVLPDEIWAGDWHAFTLATQTFPGACVRFVPNEYFEDMKKQIEAVGRAPEECGNIHVLYVTEPISVAAEKEHRNPRHWGYTEFEALDEYLVHLRSTAVQAKVVVRRHPAEPSGKYDAILAKHRISLRITESLGRTLVEDCAWADWVVGCQSMAMVIAVHAGKLVFSSIPGSGARMALPYPEIVQLFGGNS